SRPSPSCFSDATALQPSPRSLHDALPISNDFVEHGWQLKRLHKLIMTSTAYRQSSRRDPRREQRDPENRLYWRKPVDRLDAEVIDRKSTRLNSSHQIISYAVCCFKQQIRQ